jgi:hypothetical protein
MVADNEKNVFKKHHDETDTTMPKPNGLVKKTSINGQIGNGNSVITKESLMLVPDKAIPTSSANQVKDQEQSQVIQDNNHEVNNLSIFVVRNCVTIFSLFPVGKQGR